MLRTTDDIKNVACDSIVDRVDIGAGVGTMEFYSGARPGSLGGSPDGDLLAVVSFHTAAFGDAGDVTPGVASANMVPRDTVGVDDGTIGFAQVLDGDGVVLWDTDSIGVSDAEVIVNTMTISNGVDFSVTAYTFNVADPS